jgi:hypothetical protein
MRLRAVGVLGVLVVSVGCTTTVDMAPVMAPDQPHATIPYTGVRSEQFPDYGAVKASILTPDGRASAKGSP